MYMKPKSLKDNAIYYRRRGFSYNMISDRMGVKKSTIAYWTKEIPFKPNKEVIRRIGFGKLKSAIFKQNRRIAEIKEMKEIARKELGLITKRDLWMLGVGLYLGEGSKLNEYVRIINSDPEIIKTALMWFRKICGLENKNLIPAVHAYPDNNINSILDYWSKITGIPKKQFGKTQIDRRGNKSGKRKRKLPYGTLHLYTKSCGNKNLGKRLHRRIVGWLESALKQINAGVVQW